MATSPNINLSASDRKTLESWLRATKTEQRMVLRAKIILLSAENQTNVDIAKQLRISALTVGKWRTRFSQYGINGLIDSPRSGKPNVYDEETEKRVLKMIDEPPPEGFASWNGSLLAKALGDVSPSQVWRILRKNKIQLQRRRSWCISTDPEFSVKAADIVGLYLNPPDNAVVICVDEKPGIQALERSQGWLKLPDGKAITGFSHEYKRHGTINLFAALEVATGLVKTGNYKRKRREEFLDFMDKVVESYSPDMEIHVILDNYSTHKVENDKWMLKHKNVKFHYTPTHASWLNQVEIWFSILWRNALKGANFTSPAQICEAIERFVTVYNPNATPFKWEKVNVHSVSPKRYYMNL